MTSPSERLKTARLSAGYSTAGDFAAAHGFTSVTYRSHESGVRNFKALSAQAYAAALKLPHPSGWRWLLFGDAMEKPQADVFGRSAMTGGVMDHRDDYTLPHKHSGLGSEMNDLGYTAIPLFDVSASAGAGAEPMDSPATDHLVFSRATLQQVSGGRTNGLAGLSVHGDSMEPTLNHGDQILVDLTITSPAEDGIYVLRLDNNLMVKRLSIDPFRRLVTVNSDNRIYTPITGLSLDQVEVVGRVIWLGRRL